MITVRLMGGLGNQMFQYAAARRLSLRHRAPLRLDVGWFDEIAPGDTPRHYELGAFVLDQDVVAEPVRIPSRRSLAALRRRPRVLRERPGGFNAELLVAPDDVHLVGFWASERYFADAADAVRRDFTLRHGLGPRAQEVAAAIAASEVPVGVHVRRGDYLSNPDARRFHGVLEIDYYRRATALVAERAGPLHLFVFSDDPDWCERSFDVGHPTTVVQPDPGASPAEDLMLIASCDHHVVANSTFGWWGAWLHAGSDGVVVAPARWALDPSVDFSGIYAPGWLRV